MALDVQALRAETPGCGLVRHFNHASCSLPPRRVIDAMTAQLEREALYGPSEMGVAQAPAIETIRADAAALLGADPDEIALMGGGSQGWGSAFAALPPLREGDRVLVGRHEWGGNLSTLSAAADRVGARVEVVPGAADGTIDPDALRRMIDGRVRLIAVTWFPATHGVVNPAEAIGAVAREAGVPYFVDAGQAIGQVPVDVRAIGCDVLKGAGRKFLRGPRGTALLYVRRGFADQLAPAYLDVSSGPWGDEGPEIVGGARRFETAEKPIASVLGLGEGIALNRELGQTAITEAIHARSDTLRQRLRAVPGLTVLESGETRSALTTAAHERLSPAEIRLRLAEQSINVSALPAAYGPFDLPARGLSSVLRLSVSYMTSEAEIDALGEALAAL